MLILVCEFDTWAHRQLLHQKTFMFLWEVVPTIGAQTFESKIGEISSKLFHTTLGQDPHQHDLNRTDSLSSAIFVTVKRN